MTLRRSAPGRSRSAPGGYGGIDRAAHRRTDPDWLAWAWPAARVLAVGPGRVPVRDDGGRAWLAFVRPDAAPSGERYFLGVAADGQAYFAVNVDTVNSGGPAGSAASVGVAFTAVLDVLRERGHLLDQADTDLLLTAIALVNWHARHAYSPRTGRPTTMAEGGWTRVTDDGETIFPRTDPAVIVLVHDGVAGPDGRCLLAHNAAWIAPGGRRRFACLAGFVEPGESLEAAVMREVREETGIEVEEIRYFSSQPWPFPSSLMLGFTARAASDAIRVDQDELENARRFTREEMRDMLKLGTLQLPFKLAISHHLIENWFDAGELGPLKDIIAT